MLPPEGIPFLDANDISIERLVALPKTSDIDALKIQPVQGEGKRAGVVCTDVWTDRPFVVLEALPELVFEHEIDARP
jgi:hypothetical protein